MKNFNFKKGLTRTSKFGVALKRGGFTLIELLVVVAIIGILASVVLASLSNARKRGTDAAIKNAMSSARDQAALFFDTGQTYTGVCTAVGGISPLISSAAQKLLSTNTVGINSDNFVYDTNGGAGSSVCHDSGTAFAAITSLKNPTTASAGWCVDSTGASREATSLPANVTACP